MKDSNNIIGKANGATSYFVLSRNNKLTLKQKIQKTRFQLRKKWIEKHISANGHTLDEVCLYVQEKYGFREVTRACSGVQYEYEENFMCNPLHLHAFDHRNAHLCGKRRRIPSHLRLLRHQRCNQCVGR